LLNAFLITSSSPKHRKNSIGQYLVRPYNFARNHQFKPVYTGQVSMNGLSSVHVYLLLNYVLYK
jgi:hypothetical protein